MATKLIELQQGGLRFLGAFHFRPLELEHRRLDGTAFKQRSHPRHLAWKVAINSDCNADNRVEFRLGDA